MKQNRELGSALYPTQLWAALLARLVGLGSTSPTARGLGGWSGTQLWALFFPPLLSPAGSPWGGLAPYTGTVGEKPLHKQS